MIPLKLALLLPTVIDQLGGLARAKFTVNKLAAAQGLPPVINPSGRLIKPDLISTEYRITPLPRFNIKLKRFKPTIKLTEIYLLHVQSNRTLTITL